MAGYILIFTIVLLVVLLIINNKADTKVSHIIAGDADTIVSIDASTMRSNFIYFLDKEVFLRPRNVFVGKLIGNSMSARGLLCDDVVFGRKVTNPMTEKYQPGDLLVIRITNPERYGFGKIKIREYKCDIDADQIQTIKYENDQPKESHPHNRVDVVAVVDRYVRSSRALRRVLA
jgi:hypothetical protein